MHYIRYTFIMTLASLSLSAQVVSQDSINNLQRQKEVIELSEKLNEHKSELAKLRTKLGEKEKEAAEASAKSQQSASANTIAATQLTGNPQDKKLANDANKKAKAAQRDAKSARKALDSQVDLQKDIASLESKISEEEQKLNGMQGTAFSAAGGSTSGAAGTQTAAVTVPSQQQNTQQSYQQQAQQQQPAQQQYAQQQQQQPVYQPQGQQQPVYQNQDQQQNYQQPSNNQVQTRNYSANGTENADMIANRVVEQTYKSFGQQSGQPAIIINNIIVPSDYNKEGQRPNMAGGQNFNMSPQDRQEFEDYKNWQRERRGQQVNNYQHRPDASAYPTGPAPQGYSEDHLTFKERFGERTRRKSGIWVIPMAGIHASNFDANLKDGTAEGRSGWNAGLDFRIHVRRFFIQPGAHYFSSTTEVTSEDSLGNAPLLHGPRIHMLKVPLMIGVYLTKEQGAFFKFNIKGGVVGNYLLAVDKGVDSRFRKDNLEEYSYGLNGGIGLEFGFITIDLSHEWGMSNLFKNSDIKNNILRATLGFKI
ncbi:porin family protein [Dyadobacter sandarakinus]|uniref:Outer membrane beta-barrel protein n=1 Tax=Dyadobacter sandarakinus TaxID=2747268 RepID=A0ABX7I589_9BACT|nr:porin family protein [Dyadobacter sandarakinus]QRR01264.1 outer membrane beta-barrel protein [Dyadobacter sandarakinus]